MMDFSIWVGGLADRGEVMSLCRETLLAEDTADSDGLSRVLWEAHDGRDGLRLLAHVGGRLVGAGFATLAPGDHQVVSGSVAMIAVQPAARRSGVARVLLARLEARLDEAGATEVWTGGGQPQYWWPGIDVRYDAALQFFARMSYARVDEVPNMTVSLSARVVSGPLPDGVEIRRLTAAEAPDFHRWMQMAWYPEWAREVQMALVRDPISCFVAREGGDYLGFAAYDTNHLGWFGPMGTLEAARGRGLGATLLRCCLRDYLDRGATECQVAWAGPQDFYRNAVGAEVSRTFVRMRKAISSPERSAAARA